VSIVVFCSFDAGNAAAHNSLSLELKSSVRWCHQLPSTWIILRYETLAELSVKLRELLPKEGRLLVMPAMGPGDGWLPKEAWDWINDHVPRAW
jgi:hypothetical protein